MAPDTSGVTAEVPRKIVIIGYGVAAHRLAARLLLAEPDGSGSDRGVGLGLGEIEVTVYAGEEGSPYDRTLLPELVTGRYTPTSIGLTPLSDPRLRVRHGIRATSVDRMNRLVHTSDGWVEPYDALVLATGANPVLPPIRGLRTADGLLPGVHAVHTLDDFRLLSDEAASATHSVVIGGGVTGFRVAEALHTMRNRDPWRAPMHVELIDQSPARPEIMPANAFLALRTVGVVAYQDCRVRVVEEGPDGRVSGLVLADGYRLSCDLAVIACGTAPNVALAWRSGLAVARGVVVDDALRSVSDPNIYALGDCAEHRRTITGRADAALEQAEVLADRLSGRDPHRTYRGAAAPVLAGSSAA
jgi:assimilatory nitrate reductase electron transfer subunit